MPNFLFYLIMLALLACIVVIACRGFIQFQRHVSQAIDYRRADKITSQQTSSGSPALDEAVRNLHHKGFPNYAAKLARFTRLRSHYPPSRALAETSTNHAKVSSFRRTGVLLDNLCSEVIRHFDGIVAIEDEIEQQDASNESIKRLDEERNAILEHIDNAFNRARHIDKKIRGHGDRPPAYNNHALEQALNALNQESASQCSVLNRLQKNGLIPPKDTSSSY